MDTTDGVPLWDWAVCAECGWETDSVWALENANEHGIQNPEHIVVWGNQFVECVPVSEDCVACNAIAYFGSYLSWHTRWKALWRDQPDQSEDDPDEDDWEPDGMDDVFQDRPKPPSRMWIGFDDYDPRPQDIAKLLLSLACRDHDPAFPERTFTP